MSDRHRSADDTFPGERDIEAWVLGWTRTRETLPPTRHDGFFHVQVGELRQQARYIMTTPDYARVRALISRIHDPHVYIKLFEPIAVVASLLPDNWQLDPQAHLMATTLSSASLTQALPPGYRMQTTRHELFTGLEIETCHGELAASGRLALAHDYAIFDQIETHKDHQRRGLGRYVMQALGHIAREQGARRAILGATEEGRALYDHLGWTVLSPLTSIAMKMES
ncbi:GNAT family N-acetyltransferase [Kushneria phosphatilytica]|uniref:GNAT family N-acetyltransferase n=1 Tax=Kushneria phosphatilytica TaxID=657387 RepID=A0A1S1P1Y7_9GAMM|nr:GNAT family N-acetyltransferase [Kushneria phosphatilytica]OHV12810.1 hypothetical protein BH688_01860 [Kushneria phosphatilytica]QEL10656.1 GNAT family N-acetyltransferase [Kushneria phosphatilytica]